MYYAPQTGPQPPSGYAPILRWRRLFTRYLLATGAVLTFILLVVPPSPSEQPDPTVAHRLEQIRVDGRGPLTSLGRVTLHASAWLAAVTVDRQRALLDPTPLASRVGQPLTAVLHTWHDPANQPVQIVALVLVMALAAATALARQGRRSFAVALVGMLLAAVAVTRPATVLAVAGFPGHVAAGFALRVVGTPAPSPLLGAPSLQVDPGLVDAQRQLGDAWWTAFVTANVSRADTATPILTQAPPAKRSGLLDHLQRTLIGGRDGSAGGLQRVVVGVSALVSTGVFAAFASALAALAWISQTLLFVLVLAALVLAPLACDPRWWRILGRYWLAPMAAVLVLLFASALGTWLVTSAAVTFAGAGEWLLSLLSGSTVAIAAVWVVWLRARRLLAGLLHARVAPARQANPAHGAVPEGKEWAA
jgi:hypothetical protein